MPAQHASNAHYATSMVLDTPDGSGGFTSTTLLSAMTYDMGDALKVFVAGRAVTRDLASTASTDFDWEIVARYPSRRPRCSGGLGRRGSLVRQAPACRRQVVEPRAFDVEPQEYARGRFPAAAGGFQSSRARMHGGTEGKGELRDGLVRWA